MKDLHLPISAVNFDEKTHTYTLNGKKLRGITGIIRQYICPDKYADVPQFVLDKAAERGTNVHKDCGLYLMGFAPAERSADLQAFIDVCSKIEFAAIEYLVSDNHNFASAIDLVGADDFLYDIKTTAKLDIEYLQWQLSIYAWLYEAQTGRKVNGLRAIYIRNGVCKIVDIERLPNEYVSSLLHAAADNAEWSRPFPTK